MKKLTETAEGISRHQTPSKQMKMASADPCKKVAIFSISFEGSQMIS